MSKKIVWGNGAEVHIGGDGGLTGTEPPPMWHVIPINDLKEHIDSEDCWCGPWPSDDEPNVIVHNSLDGREKFENTIN